MSTLFLFTALLALACDLAVALAALLLPRTGRSLGPGRVALAACATTVSFCAKLPILAAVGLEGFGVVFLAWLDLTFLLPICGVVVLVGARRGCSVGPGIRGLAWATLCIPLVAGHAALVEPYKLELERATVALDDPRGGSDPITVGVIADLQTGRVTHHEREAVARLMAERPDVILLPGDLYQGDHFAGFQRELPAFRELMSELSAPGGVYFVLGDTDRLANLREIFEGTEVRMLVDEFVRVEVRDRVVTIFGSTLFLTGARSKQGARTLEELKRDDDIRILLAHRPGHVYNLRPDTRVDLVVAGHTHGGQVSLPGFGPPITLSDVPRAAAEGGLSVLNGRRLYVSRGVGMERGQAPPMRFFCPPEVSLLTLTDS